MRRTRTSITKITAANALSGTPTVAGVIFAGQSHISNGIIELQHILAN
jgi:hypothetical protein